ncbi:hypothetical protein [Angustibacter aerolatus]
MGGRRHRSRRPRRPRASTTEDAIMSETDEFTRRALQESMDLRDQGHSDD